jgi:hypothetical protein
VQKRISAFYFFSLRILNDALLPSGYFSALQKTVSQRKIEFATKQLYCYFYCYFYCYRDPTRNLARFAEVWTDDYKTKLYRRTTFTIPDSFKNSPSLQKRKDLRQNLKCKSFRWFLDEIFPQFVAPEDFAGQFGFLHSPNLEWCLAISAAGEIIWEQCRFQSYGSRPLEQLWELTSNGQLRSFGSKEKLTGAGLRIEWNKSHLTKAEKMTKNLSS